MSFTAKDVQALRQATGAGMMDAKKALEANDGDMEEAKQWLREKGLAASAKRDDRENTQGVVALVIDGNVGAMVKLKSETDFVAGSDQFKPVRFHLDAPAGPLGSALRAMEAAKVSSVRSVSPRWAWTRVRAPRARRPAHRDSHMVAARMSAATDRLIARSPPASISLLQAKLPAPAS